MSSISKKINAKRLDGVTESVWNDFVKLSIEYNPLNLGQGFPDFAAPEVVTRALSQATTSDNTFLNQYTRGFVCIMKLFVVIFHQNEFIFQLVVF